jgi:IS5 family transposase
VQLAQCAGLVLKQAYEREGKRLRRRAGGYAHAKQFRRLRHVLKRQRTVLGRLLRDIERKLSGASDERKAQLRVWLERAWRICRQRPKDKNKLYALHAPEVECIGKGKARQPYEFGVKVSLAITEKQGLIVGARTFAGSVAITKNCRKNAHLLAFLKSPRSKIARHWKDEFRALFSFALS